MVEVTVEDGPEALRSAGVRYFPRGSFPGRLRNQIPIEPSPGNLSRGLSSSVFSTSEAQQVCITHCQGLLSGSSFQDRV